MKEPASRDARETRLRFHDVSTGYRDSLLLGEWFTKHESRGTSSDSRRTRPIRTLFTLKTGFVIDLYFGILKSTIKINSLQKRAIDIKIYIKLFLLYNVTPRKIVISSKYNKVSLIT